MYFGRAIMGDTVLRAPMLPGFLKLFGLKNVMERCRGIIKFSLS